jgi:manganese transport protein
MAVAPPTTFVGRLAQLGPGLIISAAIVGSGELIVVPKLGAATGFALLWFLVLGCVLKVFVQIELARHAIAHQETTLVSLDTIPGPRWRISWVLWAWLVMYCGTVLQVGGIIGGITLICGMLGLNWPPWVWLVLTTGSGIALLVSGRYGPVERYATAMVAIFTLSALVAVVALQWTEFRVTSAQWQEGLWPASSTSFTLAFAAFGVTGVGASELIYYPYWCLEKGYGRSVGPPPAGGLWTEQRAGWVARAQGWLRVMRLDAFVSMLIYTLATIAFYVLGAAVLHKTARNVGDNELIGRLADMYHRSLGDWSHALFLVGALAVLYSTFFVATASNARLLVDIGGLLGVPAAATPTAEARRKAIRACCVFLPLTSATAFVAWPQPVTLVLIGAFGQGLMLPLLGGAAVYFRHRRLPPDLAPTAAWTVALWTSAVLIAAVGAYQLGRTIGWL